MRRMRVKGMIDGADMMVDFQLRCGCIFGEADGRKIVVLCDHHQEESDG